MISCSQDDTSQTILENENTEVEDENGEDEGDNEETPTESNSLKSFTVDKNGDLYSFYFHYDNNKIDKLAYVNKLDEITYYSFEYNETERIQETIKYIANPSNTSVDFSNSNNFSNAESSLTHSYHTNNKLQEIAGFGYAYTNGLVDQIMSTTMFPTTNISYDANNKIEKTETYLNNHDPGSPRYFEFDNKINPFYKLFDEFGFVVDKNLSIPNNGSIASEINRVLNDLYCISPYNIDQKRDENNYPSYNVEYTYNNDDYPLEGVFTYEDQNQQEVIKYTIFYDYFL
ncbi:hypothetical protein ACFQ3R_03415 [Mesonia ostreae]|uniref:DUF4595 domain-containing protein n=1 Tax=Mesonia ostreae TaxID=861110 RepID=A0ABU2KKN0_9FLAO|nr:hypothetical protein [Mesonia ostreae]MDT0295286.1 hypothetical protein [Mesonia ostreae]